ncbi:MAG: SPASM domain-containing protein [Alphaproteobacteria bacterium]|nr:SPASM domain-containing protein [Alphaproteobacteria bacterium]
MESIYYVMTWLCHRRCVHCYDARFRPYVRGALDKVVGESTSCMARIIDNLPERMTYRDREHPNPDGTYSELPGRIILAGGEVLLDPVREVLLYPAIERLVAKYKDVGGVRVIVQTTGDRITEKILDEMLERGIWRVVVSGMDEFHVGHEGDKRLPLIEKLEAMFEAAGMAPSGRRADDNDWMGEEGPVYSIMGATPDTWIGEIWPRGRAWENELSTAGIADNFCSRWSGGLNFMNHGWSGSEVSIEPNGNLFPCCIKTKAPLGNLTEERLTDILDSLAGHPVFEAINAGRPERMGLTYGWDVERFLAESSTETPSGKPYRNLCIGCDRFHEKVLGPVIEELRAQRLARRAA